MGLLSRFLFFLGFFTTYVDAYQASKDYLANEKPHVLKDVKITEKLGDLIGLETSFLDSEGKEIFLKEIFQDKPVLLTIVYYNCPSLCNFHLNGLFEAKKQLSKTAGKDYEFVALSMDHRESHSLARAKKMSYLKEYGKEGENFYFLTGDESSIQNLSDSLGFSFRWDEKNKQYAHHPVAYVLSEKGLISRYLYGVDFDPETLKLALIEASEGTIRNVIDRILLFCYQFDPNKNTYTLYAYNIMRIGAALMVVFLIAFLVPFWLKKRN